VVIRYAPRDHTRQDIPWVEYNDGKGHVTEFRAADVKPEAVKDLQRRVMDCMDCHNRPTHTLELPERAVDRALALGEISPSLPFVKKVGVDLLKKPYSSQAEAGASLPAALAQYYKEKYLDLYNQRRAEISRSARALLAIYDRNVFPEMKVTWGSYPNNIGHTDFTGCFRCHDDAHAASDGRKIKQDCAACHELLAMEEPAPKILTDLGIQQTPVPTGK
jgi:formate-dependent nitrite reductase cytochrome c552 subunit